MLSLISQASRKNVLSFSKVGLVLSVRILCDESLGFLKCIYSDRAVHFGKPNKASRVLLLA